MPEEVCRLSVKSKEFVPSGIFFPKDYLLFCINSNGAKKTQIDKAVPQKLKCKTKHAGDVLKKH